SLADGCGGADMLIDCDDCLMQGLGCADCVVTVLLGTPSQGVELDEVECQALAVLADGGLVPPLRLATATRGAQGPPPRLPGTAPDAGPGPARRPAPGSAAGSAERVARPEKQAGETRRRGGRARRESGELSHSRPRHAAG